MLKRKEKKSKPLREGSKLHERIISGVLAAATVLTMVPMIESGVTEVEALDYDILPPTYYTGLPTSIQRGSYKEPDPTSYVSALTGKTNYAFTSDFTALDGSFGSMMGGSAPGLCSFSGKTFVNNGQPWTIDLSGTAQFDMSLFPTWQNMLDYYWGFLACQTEIQKVCDLRGITDPASVFGEGTPFGTELQNMGLWCYYSNASEVALKLRAQAQAIHWWQDSWRRDYKDGLIEDYEWDAALDVLKIVDNPSSITSFGDYLNWINSLDSTHSTKALISGLAAERITIERAWGLYGTTQDSAFENVARLIYYAVAIHEGTSDPARPSNAQTTIYNERYNINYGLYLPSGYVYASHQPFLVGMYDFYIEPTTTTTGSWHSAVGVQKVDGSGSALDGAEFGIYYDEACTSEAFSSQLTSSGEIIWEVQGNPLWTDPDNAPPSEDFWVKELNPPPGYEPDTGGPYKATANFVKTTESYTVGWANGGIPIVNILDAEWIAKVGVYKVDETGSPLANAVFTCYDSAGNSMGSQTTNSSGYAYWSFTSDATDKPDNETYTIEETSAPPGYNLIPGDWPVTAIYCEATDTPSVDIAGGTSGIANSTNEEPPSSGLIKKDFATGEIVGPATFTFTGQAYSDIYLNNIAEGTIADKSDVLYEAEVTYDFILSDGTSPIQWHDPTAANYIAPGRYILTESVAPPGYILPVDTVHSKRLDIGMEKLVFEIANSQYPIIEINKYEKDTLLGLPGASFDVKIDTTSLGTLETDENGKIFITYDEYKNFLPDYKESWTVTVEEMTAPAGYINDNAGKPVSHELSLGQSLQTFVFYNTKYPDGYRLDNVPRPIETVVVITPSHLSFLRLGIHLFCLFHTIVWVIFHYIYMCF